VRHYLGAKIPELEGYYTGRLPYCDDDKLTLGEYVINYLGEYVINYNDGKEERHPVFYSLNASVKDVKTSRIDGTVSWSYATDGRIDSVVPAALPVKTEEGFAYECVFPVKEGAVDCHYEPKENYKDALKVISIELV
jgi:hypothetical protein